MLDNCLDPDQIPNTLYYENTTILDLK